MAADFTGGHSRVKGAFGVGFADDGLAAVTLDPRASAALGQALRAGWRLPTRLPATTTEPRPAYVRQAFMHQREPSVR